MERRRDHGAKQDAGGEARRQDAAGKADAVCCNMFGHKDPGAGDFAAHGYTLHDAQEEKRDRRPYAKLGIDRQQTHPECRNGHHQDADRKHHRQLTIGRGGQGPQWP